MSNWCKEKLSNFVKYVQWEQVAVEEQSFYSKSWYQRFVRIIDYTNRDEPPRYIPYTGTKSLVGRDDIVMIRYWSQTAWKAVRWIPWVIANNMFRINIDKNREWKKIDKDFLFHYLSSKSIFDYLHKGWGSSTMPAISFNLMNDLWVCFPEDIEEQHKIAKILSTIDDKIELNNKINSELEAMAKELYEYWFVQFDFPDEKGKPYKSSGWKMVWNDELKREIPEGWSVENIGNVADLYQPKNLSWNDLLDDGKYLVYGANWIVWRYNEFNHKENEIAVCCRGASCGCFLMTLPEAWITWNAMVITPNSERVTKEYLYFGLSYDRIAPFITGSAQPQITRTNLETLKIIIPNKNILNKFNSFATGIRKKLQNVQYQSNNLSELRDFLLPMLMNGQVTVK